MWYICFCEPFSPFFCCVVRFAHAHKPQRTLFIRKLCAVTADAERGPLSQLFLFVEFCFNYCICIGTLSFTSRFLILFVGTALPHYRHFTSLIHFFWFFIREHLWLLFFISFFSAARKRVTEHGSNCMRAAKICWWCEFCLIPEFFFFLLYCSRPLLVAPNHP